MRHAITPMRILAIDPGTAQSAWLIYDVEASQIVNCGIDNNQWVCDTFYRAEDSGLTPVIEMVACYGMPVGKETFETCVWIGRFLESFGCGELIYRKDIKLHLCQSMRAKDANVRQALLDLHSSTGGGATPQVGTKSKPGPLYGVKSHIWSALAIAITYRDTYDVQGQRKER